MFSVNTSVAFGRQEYPGTNFGLRNNDNHVYSFGFDVVPSDKVSVGGSYGYEKYTALQASRTANPLPAGASINDPTQQFNDPRRDWTDDSADKVKTFNTSFDLLKVIPKTEVRLGYDYSRAQSTYVYSLAANTTIAAPVQLPAVINELQRGTLDVQYFLTRHLAIGGVYWYDSYDVSDFSLSPDVVSGVAQPAVEEGQTATVNALLLNYFYRPFNAHTAWVRLTYGW